MTIYQNGKRISKDEDLVVTSLIRISLSRTKGNDVVVEDEDYEKEQEDEEEVVEEVDDNDDGDDDVSAVER
ncbi:hypothetical protein KPH14_010901 [Odynerus spinipes]|uniref:Uncharacterized protein n=1 Tax=Odynerus spinipes TaxID=1348599 RepID=A0AAD9RHJ9_9HYME|nr:hypothetical protein KPH14_010901 [Odynerus spinipes]